MQVSGTKNSLLGFPDLRCYEVHMLDIADQRACTAAIFTIKDTKKSYETIRASIFPTQTHILSLQLNHGSGT